MTSKEKGYYIVSMPSVSSRLIMYEPRSVEVGLKPIKVGERVIKGRVALTGSSARVIVSPSKSNKDGRGNDLKISALNLEGSEKPGVIWGGLFGTNM
jgi:hypothetical protein